MRFYLFFGALCLSATASAQTLQTVTNAGSTTTNSMSIANSYNGDVQFTVQNTDATDATARAVLLLTSGTTINAGFYLYNANSTTYPSTFLIASGGSAVNGMTIKSTAGNIILTPAGNVGIGTTSPIATLDVNGTVKDIITNAYDPSNNYVGGFGRAGTMTGGFSSIPNCLGIAYFERDFVIGGWGKTTHAWQGPALYINSDNGNVLIGQTTQVNTNYKLDVAGGVRANQVTVNTTGADYVFDSSYQRMPLADLARYTAAYKHLPEVPSASQMQAAGVDLGDMQRVQLAKIEELTLYAIEADRKIETADRQIATLETQLKSIQEEVQAMKKAAAH
jgi:hypothetical protein